MNGINKYQEVLASTNKIALATATENIPNVRIVNFCFNPEKPDILYFASDRDNRKVREFARNNIIAFTSVPTEGILMFARSKPLCKKASIPLTM